VSIDPSSNLRGWWDFQLVYRATPGGTRLASWALGGVDSSAAAAAPPSGPTFDTSAVFTSSTPTAGALNTTATVPITVSEPVDYTLRVFPAETSGPLQCPSGRPPSATGHLDRTGTVTVPALCVGTSYRAQLTLVDAAGNTAMWDSFGTDPSGLWTGALFRTAGLPSTLHYDFTASGPAHGYVSDLEIVLQGNSGVLDIVPLTDAANGHCTSGDQLHVSGTIDGSHISEVTEVVIAYRIRSTILGICTPAGSESLIRSTTLNFVTVPDLIHATPAVTVRDAAGRYALTMSLVPTP
jgi:hypothetical protein